MNRTKLFTGISLIGLELIAAVVSLAIYYGWTDNIAKVIPIVIIIGLLVVTNIIALVLIVGGLDE